MLLAAGVSSCSWFKKNKPQDADVIARAGDEYLYASDLDYITKGLKGKDSVQALKNFTETWVKKKLLLQKAADNINEDDAGITKKIDDYRETLLLYEYEKALINQKLDTVIKADELNTWYEKLKNNFTLTSDVYSVYFIRLKDDAPDLKKVRNWILKPKDESESEQLKGYCKEVAEIYSLDKPVWYEENNFFKNFPLSKFELSQLAVSKNFGEFKRSGEMIYVRVADVKKQGDPNPVELVRDKIVKAIIEKRKLQLLDRTYDKIYSDGQKAKSFEVFVK